MAHTRSCRVAAVVAAASAVLAISASPALATFPGVNGKITYASDTTGDEQIWTINPDGSDDKVITQGLGGKNRFGQWSADGSRFAFVSTRSGGEDIWILEADGRTHRPHDHRGTRLNTFSWTPDGSIVFTRKHPGASGHSFGSKDTFMSMSRGFIDAAVSAPGSTATPEVLVHSRWTDNSHATVSPNSESPRIAFISSRNGASHLYTMKIDGTDVQQKSALSPDQEVFSISWSPDARQIAFTVMTDRGGGRRADAYVISSDGDGSDRRPLAPDEADISGFPVWSPDGTKIALSLTHDDVASADHLKLAVISSTDRNDVRYLQTHRGAPGSTNGVMPIPMDWQALPVPLVPVPAPALVQPRAPLPAGPVAVPAAPTKRTASPMASAACKLAMVKISKAKFSAGQKVQISLQLNKSATVVVSFKRHGSKKVLARQTVKGKKGKNQLQFTGRVKASKKAKSRSLAPGKYVAEVVAKDSRGKKSKLHRIKFVVARR